MTSPRLPVTDLGALFVLSAIAIAAFQQVVPGGLVAGIGGLVVGMAAIVVGRWLRWDGFTTVIVAVAAYFLLGTPLAVPAAGIAFVIPTLSSLVALAVGPALGWADIVTLAPPVSAPLHVSVVPYFAGWAGGVVSAALAFGPLANSASRPWMRAVALLGPAALLVAGLLLGDTLPFFAAARGVAFSAVAVAWLGSRNFFGGSRAGGPLRSSERARLLGAIGAVAGALVVGIVGGSLAAPPNDDRFVLREHLVPPFDPLNYPSPLAGFRKYTKVLPDEVLFSVDGLAAGQVLRLATMDSYTGKLWNVAGSDVATSGSGAYVLAGERWELPPSVEGTPTTITVTVRAYADVWIPTVGVPESVHLGTASMNSDDLRYNSVTGSLVLTSGLESGDEVTLTSLVPPVPDLEQARGVQAAAIDQPSVDHVPGILIAKAQEFTADAATPAEKLLALQAALHSGYLSHGLVSDVVPSAAGHGADRMTALFESNYLLGDQEQYSSAFALMARELGFATRVVMGFAPVATADGAVDVRGSDVTAWPEVALEGLGWVAFDPTPENTDVPQDLEPKPRAEPQPQVRQPPRTLTDQNKLLTGVTVAEPPEEPEVLDLWWILWCALGISGATSVVLVPVSVIDQVRRGRSRRRRTSGTADERAAGAWSEFLDVSVEHGFLADRALTRREQARSLEYQAGTELTVRDAERHHAWAAEMRYVAERDQIAAAASTDGRLVTLGRSARARAKALAARRPGRLSDDVDIEKSLGVDAFAIEVDTAVFAGSAIPDGILAELWRQSEELTERIRQAVSWRARLIGRFRLRSDRAPASVARLAQRIAPGLDTRQEDRVAR